MSQVNQSEWRKYAICGAIVVAGMLCFRYLRKIPDDQQKITNLKHIIDRAYEDSDLRLCSLTVDRRKILKDQNVELECLFIKRLKKKQEDKKAEMKNPFIPPFEKGQLICEMPPNHRLIFNKYNLFEKHLLVVTKEFRDQTERLSREDFQQVLLTTKALKGSFFFNCGQKTGYSQKHKHIQILPQMSLQLPILSRIREAAQRKQLKLLRKVQKDIKCQLYTYQPFEFLHVIVVIEEGQKLSDLAAKFKDGEQSIMNYLMPLFPRGDLDFNLIGTEELMMVVPRKELNFYEGMSLNSVTFMGSFLVKDENLFDKIEYVAKPSQILRGITYTEI